MISGATTEQIDRIIKDHGLLECFPRILVSHKPQVKQRGLEALCALLKAGGTLTANEYTQYIEDAGILELVEDLAENDTFTTKANQILTYFPLDDDEEEEESENKKEEAPENSQPQQKVEDQETKTQEFEKED